MNIRSEAPAVAERAALRLRQRKIGRELRLLYERILREPLPADMLDALFDADARPPGVERGAPPPKAG